MKFKTVRILSAAPAALLSVFVTNAVLAQDASTLAQANQYAAEGQSMGQVTSVSQLRDVQPTDWAFQALQSLVERYGCIAGYPDGTYRGNRAMTRYEFAAGLNACLDRVNELIASATADLVTAEDLAVLQRLQEEFQSELATLRGRVDALEARTAELEANQFSTTTKLQGQVIFDVGSVFAGETAARTANPATVTRSQAEDEVTLAGRVRLRLRTSFTGKDELRTRLVAANFGGYAGRFQNGRSLDGADITYDSNTVDGGGGTNFQLDELYYRFPLGSGRAFAGVLGVDFDNVVPTTVSYTTNYAFLEEFQHNPAIYEHDQGAGFGYSLPIGEKLNIAAAYMSDSIDAGSAGETNGLTGGSNTAAVQLTFTPTDRLVAALSYARTYDPEAASNPGVRKGTDLARRPFGNDPLDGKRNATSGDHFGASLGFKLSSKLNLSGWVGYSQIEEKEGSGEADIFNWAVTLGFPDLFREGNYGGLAIGATPYVTSGRNLNSFRGRSDDMPLAAQAFYSFAVSDNIAIQPQLFYISNPNGDDRNDSIWAGSVKTTFSF